jgi:hypothetical protein
MIIDWQQPEDDYALYMSTLAELEAAEGPITADEINFGATADSEGEDDENVEYPF